MLKMPNWKKLGLKAGLEIHQRLGTKQKLFCSCSAAFSEKPSDLEVFRKLRPVAGETGEVDIAALHETLAGKRFIYKTYPGESCLICSDSEPPREVNPEALEIALEIAMLLNCEIPDEIHIMRKTVIDGSNPTSFQRTAIIGLNGSVPTSFGRVAIPLVALEEEASQILKKEKSRAVFGLSRLGIPLVEIATAPDIKTPEQGKELAEKLGMILRSSRVARGLGSIRQDLNVSIQKGARTEIKGVQDLKGIPRLIEGEAARQLSLIEKKKPVEKTVRKANPDGSTDFLRPLPGSARMYPETDCFPIRLNETLLKKIKNNLPELLEEKTKKLTKDLGIDSSLLKALEKAGKLELFKLLSSFKNIKPHFTAKILLSYPTDIKNKSKSAKLQLIKNEHFELIFKKLDKGLLPKDAVLDILIEFSLGKKPDLEKFRAKGVDNLEQDIEEVLKAKPGLSFSAYMGILMGRYKGRVSGEEIAKALKKALV